MQMFSIKDLPQNELSNFINFSNAEDRIEISFEGESFHTKEATFKNMDTGLYFTINEIDYKNQEEFQKSLFEIKIIIRHKFTAWKTRYISRKNNFNNY